MSRKRENRSDWQPGGNQYSRKAGVPENPLYPPHKESNVAGVLLAIGAVIVALVCLAQIVTHFNYSARPYRQYVSQTGAGQTLAEDPGLAEAAGDQAVDYEEIFATVGDVHGTVYLDSYNANNIIFEAFGSDDEEKTVDDSGGEDTNATEN